MHRTRALGDDISGSSEPLISVVIPTWNRRQLVQEAIASVMAQTYSKWELIVVDDGSTDGTIEALGTFTDPRMNFISSEHIGNLGQLRDLGAVAGRGEWLAFLDSDDVWNPEKLELQLRELARTGTDWSYTAYQLIDDRKIPIPLRTGRLRAISGWIILDLLAERTGICSGTLVARRTLFEAVGGFSKNGIYAFEDVDLALRLALAAPVAALPEALTRVRDHPGRMSATLQLGHHHMARVYEAVLRTLSDPRALQLARGKLAYHLAEEATQRMRRRERRTAVRCLARAFALGDAAPHWLRCTARSIRAGLHS